MDAAGDIITPKIHQEWVTSMTRSVTGVNEQTNESLLFNTQSFQNLDALVRNVEV